MFIRQINKRRSQSRSATAKLHVRRALSLCVTMLVMLGLVPAMNPSNSYAGLASVQAGVLDSALQNAQPVRQSPHQAPGDPRFDGGLPPSQQDPNADPMDQPQRMPPDQLARKGDRPNDLTEGNWTNISPQLIGVSAVSTTDAWAIGEADYLLHYTGGSWQPFTGLGNSWYFSDIDMVSPTNGWIAAYYAALQYDGTNWIEHDSGNLQLDRISAASDGAVWAVGRDTSASYAPVIAHWDGTSWISAGPVITSSTYLRGIDMVSSTEGWVVGYNYNYDTGTVTPVVLQYDGTNWNSVTPPMSNGYFYAVSSSGPGVMWAVGYDRSDYTYKIYRYSGGTWTSWIQPDTGNPVDISMLSANEGYIATSSSILRWDGGLWVNEYTGQQFSGVSGVAGQIWGVAGGATIMSRTGAGPWIKQQGGPTSYSLRAVSSLGVDDAWAVGSYTNGPQGTTIIHYSSGAWQPVTNTLTSSLYDVQMLSPTEGYAVGSNTIAQWDGTSWTRVAQPNTTLYGVSMTGPGQGWSVGSSGQIWRASGGTWQQVSSPVTSTLTSVAMDSPMHGWAVGYQYGGPPNYTQVGQLIEFDGTSWVDRSNLVPSTIRDLRDIVLDGNGNGWAVGYGTYTGNDTYGVMRLSNGVWTADPLDTGYYYQFSVANEALGEAWSIGCAYAFHYVDGNWQEQWLPTGWCQYGVSLVPGRGGWAVGPYGTILQYNPLSDGRRFYDVAVGSTFYSYIECMATRGIINGYTQDNTFRPNNNVTRAQLSKIVSESAGFTDDPGAQLFEDVQPGSTFYTWTNRLTIHGVIGGYACGGSGEPCVPPSNLPYFRPGNNASRGQIAKIVSEAAGFTDDPGPQIFEDVLPGSSFYDYIQRLANRSVMNGYACGGAGEPCGPNNRPYFRPANNATRGQTSKIVGNTFFPGCGTVGKK